MVEPGGVDRGGEDDYQGFVLVGGWEGGAAASSVGWGAANVHWYWPIDRSLFVGSCLRVLIVDIVLKFNVRVLPLVVLKQNSKLNLSPMSFFLKKQDEESKMLQFLCCNKNHLHSLHTMHTTSRESSRLSNHFTFFAFCIGRGRRGSSSNPGGENSPIL